MQDVLCLILGGGKGARLYPLTRTRSEPAVPVAGKYRLIDIPISNCLNSDLNRIYVLTQYLSVSLHRHLAATYKFDPFSHGFVEVLAAQQTNEASSWYQGTADAIRQNIRYVQEDRARHVLILSGDQLYRIDFRHMLQTHLDTQADVTIGVTPVGAERATGLGVVRVQDDGRIVGLLEKPKTEAQLREVRTPGDWLAQHSVAGEGRDYLANMGIYLFSRRALFELLSAQPVAHDLVMEVFPRALTQRRLQAHLFDGYWEDLGTIRSYHTASLALAGDNPPFDFNSADGVIYTRMRNLPASLISGAQLERSLISDGCVVQPGTRLQGRLLGVRSRIGRNVLLRDTVIIGADRFETDADRAANRKRGVPDFTVGDGSVIEHAILDKDCRIGCNVRIVNAQRQQNAEGTNYVIRDGIVVIPNGAVVPDGSVI